MATMTQHPVEVTGGGGRGPSRPVVVLIHPRKPRSRRPRPPTAGSPPVGGTSTVARPVAAYPDGPVVYRTVCRGIAAGGVLRALSPEQNDARQIIDCRKNCA